MPAVVAALLLVPQGQATETPRRILLQATRAVEGDSAPALEAAWRARLRRDSTDRAARLGVATLARLRFDYATAAHDYALLFTRDSAALDGYAVQARLGQASALRVRGQYGRADEWLALAVREAHAIGDSAAETESLIGLALTRIRTSAAPAESLLDSAARLVPPADDRLRGAVRCARAALLSATGRDGARAEAQAGAELEERAGDRRYHASCLHLLAQHYIVRGVMDSAGLYLSMAVGEYRAARDHAGLSVALQWLGWARGTIGDFGAARSDLRAAIGEARRSGAASTEAWANMNLAEISLRIGEMDSGTAEAARASALLAAQGDPYGEAAARALEGDMARAGRDIPRARAAYRESLALEEKSGRPAAQLTLHNGLASLAMMEADWSAAGRELDAALGIARTRGMTGWERGLDYQLAIVALGRGDLTEAERALRRLWTAPQQPVRLYQSHVLLAEVYARRGGELAIDSAGAELDAAMDELDRWRASLRERDLRLLAFQVNETGLDSDQGVATVLDALAGRGRVALAFSLAERRRARELLDRLVQGESLREEEGHEGGARDSSRRAMAAATVDDVIAALPDGRTAVVEYVTGRGGEPTTVFVLTRAGLTSHRLASIDSLEARVARFAALVESGSEAPALARELGSALLGAVVAGLPAGIVGLVVIPDDVLHRVPFEVLRTADDRPVLERFAVSIAPSAAVEVRLWRRARTRPGAGGAILALGDPMPGAGAAADSSGNGAMRGAFPRLPASGREAELVARYARRADVRLRQDASEAWLKRAPLAGFDLLHFATHAVVDERTLARTALLLSPGGGEDGVVGPGDLARLRLDAELVVLSACRTAGGVVVGGEGVQGLTGPLLEAGARAVVATQWPIGDASTVRFVSAFYAALAHGARAGAALHAAKLDARSRGAPVSEWAAFVLVGDPFARVALRSPKS